MDTVFCILRRDEWKTEAVVAKNGLLCRYLTTDAGAGSEETEIRKEIIPDLPEFSSALREELKGKVVYTFDGRELIKAIKTDQKNQTIRIADLRPMISSMKKRDVLTTKAALDLLDFPYDDKMYEQKSILGDLRAVSILHGHLNSQGKLPKVSAAGSGEYPLTLLRIVFGVGLLLCILMLILNQVES